ncbi:MAG TPA: DUF389 domain-containing protein [Bryobacteraceae bacterium]|nr:DUF389 domain-containing protein [Bryobacteraceae bacterium]
MSETDRWRLEGWLHIEPGMKPKVYRQVFATAEISNPIYWLEIFFSAGIATFGLVENSPAVIIGAMLISPLMGPIMATGLALAIGDLYLGIQAVLNLLASVVAAIAFSGLLVWLLPFHSATAEILARTRPNLLDLGIALLCGLAGSVVLCRAGDGEAAVLPGVAIAVAVMPPLCTMGFGLGSGVNLEIVGGAGLLFLTNLVAIVASAFVVFLSVRMSTRQVEEAMIASRGDGVLARVLSHGPISRTLATGGQLRWRILMLVILLASLAVPLQRALLQVAGEALTRAAVQGELKRLVSSDAVMSQQVNFAGNVIVIRLISTQRIPDARLTEVRQELMRRTGRDVQLSVEAVASKSELAELMERLDRPVPVVAKQRTLAEMQQELLTRVRPALDEIWPSADAPIQSFNVIVAASGFTVDVHYQAAKDLGPVPLGMVSRSLQAKLAMPDLALQVERTAPPRTARRRSPPAR